MVVYLVALATAAGMVLGFTGSLRRSLVVLLAYTFLLPSGLPVGHLSGLGFLPASRLVLLAVLAKLVIAALRRELPPGLFDLTPVHAAFALFLAVALVLGIALASPSTDVVNATHIWVMYASMLVFFIVVLALVRAIADEAWVTRVLMVTLGVAAGIAALEYVAGLNWNSFFYGGHPPNTVEAQSLHERLGHIRVRGPASFPLALAWLLVPGILAAIATGLRAHRAVSRAAVVVVLAVMVVAGYLTYARSIVAPVIVVLVLFPFLARRARLLLGTALASLVIGSAYLLAPSFGEHFSTTADQGSVNIRFERIPPLLADLAGHAYTGLGLGGLNNIGIPTTDATYLLVYGSIGIIGVAVLAALQLAAIVVSGRALLTTDPRRRDLAAASFLGVVALTGAGFAFDAVAVIQIQDALWVLAAMAIAMSEREFGPIRWLARPSLPRLGAVAAAFGAGILASAAAPTSIAGTVVFGTVPARAALIGDADFAGFVDVNTVCDLVSAEQRPGVATTVRCDDFQKAPGQGQLRVEAPDIARAKAALTGVTASIYSYRRLQSFRLADVPTFHTSKPTALRTAPVWMPLLIGIGMVLLPEERRTQLRRGPSG